MTRSNRLVRPPRQGARTGLPNGLLNLCGVEGEMSRDPCVPHVDGECRMGVGRDCLRLEGTDTVHPAWRKVDAPTRRGPLAGDGRSLLLDPASRAVPPSCAAPGRHATQYPSCLEYTSRFGPGQT